jgi:phosphomevalonate kinase
VETALSYALTYIYAVTKSTNVEPATITILADNDYYSQPETSKPSATAGSGRFSHFGVRLQDAHKTGLGSSAALVTALTGAVLSHYLSNDQFSSSSDYGHTQLHNLAQAAHCAAQGKVGSGFDVAAAVYGTCIYRRFSPSVLADLGEPSSSGFSTRLQQIVEDTDAQHKWDTEIHKGTVNIPNGMTLIMCDVDCGSQTVGMVKKVLEWRKQDPADANALWDTLQAENSSLAEKLLSGTPKEISQVVSNIRAGIREMSTKSGVPIEPAEQTALLDAIIDGVDGVYGGVVPGAGGYDAVALLVKDDVDTISKIQSLVVEWGSQNSSNVKLLGVKGEMEGVRKENDGKLYEEWTA